MNTALENHEQLVTQFLSQSPLKAFIGGEWVAADDGATFTTRDPGTGQPLAEVAAMGAKDVDRAVQAATKAFRTSGWAEMTPNERGVLLHRLADEVEKHKPVLARIEASDAGKILAQAEGDVQNFVDTLRYFIEISLHVQRRTPSRSRATKRPPSGCRGGHAGSSCRGTFPSCSSAGTFPRRWLRAIPS